MPGPERGSAGHKGPKKTPNYIGKNRICMHYAPFIYGPIQMKPNSLMPKIAPTPLPPRTEWSSDPAIGIRSYAGTLKRVGMLHFQPASICLCRSTVTIPSDTRTLASENRKMLG